MYTFGLNVTVHVCALVTPLIVTVLELNDIVAPPSHDILAPDVIYPLFGLTFSKLTTSESIVLFKLPVPFTTLRTKA